MKHHWDISQCQIFLSYDERYYIMLLTNGKNLDKYRPNIIIDYVTLQKEKKKSMIQH